MFDPRSIGTTYGYGVNNVSALVYGEAGSGKTTLAATTGDPARTLVLAAEPGLLPLRRVGVRFVEIDTPEKLGEVLDWLEGYARQGKQLRARWSWVILDSITEIAERVLKAMLSRPSKSGDKGHGMAAYGDTQAIMLDAIDRVRALPTHTLCVAQLERIEDVTGGLVFGPAFPGKKLGPKSPYKFDLVLAMRLAREGTQVLRWLQTAADGTYAAKDRSGALDPSEPADLAHIAAKIIASSAPMDAPADATTDTATTTESAA